MKKNILLILICIAIAACGQKQQSREMLQMYSLRITIEVKGTKA